MSIKLSKDDLEAIRNAAIAHFESGKDEFRDIFMAELKRAAILTDISPPRIGMWTVEAGADRVTLTRVPPVSSEMHYFGLYLERNQSRWAVTGEFHERERLDLN